MELLNEPLNVESAKLAAPPKGGDLLATSGKLLVMWRYQSRVLDHESGARYHLAFYHPDYGWCACRWDETKGLPYDARPASETAIWVRTEKEKLIHISLRNEIKGMVLAFTSEGKFRILYADRDDLWIQESDSSRIVQLRLQKNGLTIVDEKCLSTYVDSMHLLADGTWMLIEDRGRCVIRSSSLEKTIYKSRDVVSFHQPFLVGQDKDYYYYTEDPRRGWRRMPIWTEYGNGIVPFFGRHNDVYYAAICRDEEMTTFYRFSDKFATSVECMWRTPGIVHPSNVALYDSFVCVAKCEPIVVLRREDVPENHGFLVWDPQSNTFYKDIPQFSIMHTRHIVSRNLHIPATWIEREDGQYI